MYIILFFNLFFKKNVGHTQLHVYKCESYQAFSYDFLTYMQILIRVFERELCMQGFKDCLQGWVGGSYDNCNKHSESIA